MGSGRARLPYGFYHDSLVECPVVRVYEIVKVDLLQETLDHNVLVDDGGVELPVEGSSDRLWTGVGFSIKGNELRCLEGDSTSYQSACASGTNRASV